MYTSLGISVGNLNSYVAAGQGGGIEILLNDYSARSTPSMVAFTDHARSIGVEASSNFFMNMKNTIYDLMVLLGKSYKEIVSENSHTQYPFKFEEGPNGEPLVVVRHLGEERKFTIIQVLAMFFTKLRGIANDATDCVISCPQFYEDKQKEALIQAAAIAGLNPLQIISDMLAVALNYAYYRTTKDDPLKFVGFINFGQSNLQSMIACLTPKNDTVRVLAVESENIGGRDFDRVLADYFVREHKLNLNQKAYLKLVSACERLKKQLSSNSDAIPIHVESLISEDKDFTAKIDRATFEDLSKHLLQRVEACFKRTLKNAMDTFDAYMCDLKERAKAAESERNLAAAQAVDAAKKAEQAKANLEKAKAAAATRALEKVKKDQEAQKDAMDTGKEGNGDAPAAAEGDQSASKEVPMDAETEELTLAKNEEAQAVQNAKTLKASERSLTAKVASLNKELETKFELLVVELVGGSIRIPAVKQLVKEVFNLTPSTTLNTDEAVARGCVLHCATIHPGMKVKREVKILGADSFLKPTGGFSCDKELRQVEMDLITSDRKYKSRTEARNNLEEYIYSERSKLQEGDQLLNELNTALDWLFSDEGEEAPEEEYLTKIGELKKKSEARLSENNNKE